MKVPAAILVLVLLGSGLPVQSAEINGMQGLGDTRHHVVTSRVLDKRMHVLVGLPDDYDPNGDTDYPVVYILDGGELYPLLKAYSGYLQAGKEVPALILVGISYGTSDWEKGNDRSHDYTAPTEEREFWGGAEEFQRFLSFELLSLIEGHYRARADRRVIFGQSLGGQFVLYTAQTRPDLFWGHIASNPALHRNLPLFLSMHPDAPETQSHLFVGSASDDDPRFREPALKWIEHWSDQDQLPWRLHIETLAGHNHFSAPPASFRRGIRWLFSD
jgi:predicted alpha/beta superfamily hydrolase